MILTFIILSYILSIIGFLCYRLVGGHQLPARQRKHSLYFILIMSLLLPFGFLTNMEQISDNKNQLSNTTKTEASTFDGELLSCYKEALSEDEFCECKDLQANNLILYKSDSFYETCITCTNYVNPLWWILGGILLLVLLFRIGYLVFLVLSSKKENREINGHNYTFLYYHGAYLAASFYLFKPYIIWKEELNTLEEKDQEAVIFHEIAHLKNKDTFEQIGMSILRVIWLLNPIFYFIRDELNLIAEYLADDFAIKKTKEVKAYASLLLKLKETQTINLVQQFGGGHLKKRIIYLLNPRPSSPIRFSFLIFISGLIMGFSALKSTPIIAQQVSQIHLYRILQTEHENTGKTYFCKNCLFDKLQDPCILE